MDGMDNGPEWIEMDDNLRFEMPHLAFRISVYTAGR